MYVNASVPALNALRGTSFETAPNAPLDREAVRAYFSAPVLRPGGSLNASRRRNRRFIHLKLVVDDITRLGEAAPFAWSSYAFGREGDLFVYRQMIGPAAGKDVGNVGWTGRERVAFRLHLPSKIRYQNNRRGVDRGNILVWEQPLTERLRGVPLLLDARMDPESILNRTLWLFGWTFVAVAFAFSLVILVDRQSGDCGRQDRVSEKIGQATLECSEAEIRVMAEEVVVRSIARIVSASGQPSHGNVDATEFCRSASRVGPDVASVRCWIICSETAFRGRLRRSRPAIWHVSPAAASCTAVLADFIADTSNRSRASGSRRRCWSSSKPAPLPGSDSGWAFRRSPAVYLPRGRVTPHGARARSGSCLVLSFCKRQLSIDDLVEDLFTSLR